MIGRDAELRAALRHLPAPDPSPDLLPRILHSRVMGVRTTLPTGASTVPWRWLAAAAVVAVLIGGSWMVSLSLSRIGESEEARDSFSELLSGTKLVPPAGDARELPDWQRRPRYPLILADSLVPSRLRDGVWTYRSTTTTDGIRMDPVMVFHTRIRMTKGSYNGDPVWVVSTARRFRDQWDERADTVLIDASTLRPRYAVAYGFKRRSRTVQTFSSDRGVQSMTITGSPDAFLTGAMRLPFPTEAVFTNDWSPHRFPVVFPAIPLSKEWRGSLYQAGSFRHVRPSTLVQYAVPVDFRVRGTDRVAVPSGTFDCWRVEVETYPGWTMWITRDNGWVVKTEFRQPGRVVNDVLESYEPGS